MKTKIEERMELSEETKRNIRESEKEIKSGKTISIEVLREKVGSEQF